MIQKQTDNYGHGEKGESWTHGFNCFHLSIIDTYIQLKQKRFL